jgi:hypothetical protein
MRTGKNRISSLKAATTVRDHLFPRNK